MGVRCSDICLRAVIAPHPLGCHSCGGAARWSRGTYVSDHGPLAMAIGNGIAQLHREHYGRGANITRTTLARDHAIVFLEDIYTPLERTLIDAVTGRW